MKMMQQMMGEGFSPMEMCRQMTQAVMRASETAAYATPELRGLFDSWLQEVEHEALSVIGETGETGVAQLAERLKISFESAAFLLCKLAQNGKIDIVARVKPQ